MIHLRLSHHKQTNKQTILESTDHFFEDNQELMDHVGTVVIPTHDACQQT